MKCQTRDRKGPKNNKKNEREIKHHIQRIRDENGTGLHNDSRHQERIKQCLQNSEEKTPRIPYPAKLSISVRRGGGKRQF